MNDVSGSITVLRVIVQFINTEELMSLVIDNGITVTELIYVSVAKKVMNLESDEIHYLSR